ncbi:hypothetical protein HMPREF9069_01906 [Atopobium sp. oral taxon 810 str. F0209]|nr:hypothetical protein HMPREF9069_01906 [Atopobium sp. oral taxon 810 str. F0209]
MISHGEAHRREQDDGVGNDAEGVQRAGRAHSYARGAELCIRVEAPRYGPEDGDALGAAQGAAGDEARLKLTLQRAEARSHARDR